MTEVLALLILCAGAVGISLGVRRLRPRWHWLGISAVSAAILPGLVLALCAYVFFDSANTPSEHCGTDACGMAMMAAMMIGGFAVVAFFIGWVVTAFVQYGMRQR